MSDIWGYMKMIWDWYIRLIDMGRMWGSIYIIYRSKMCSFSDLYLSSMWGQSGLYLPDMLLYLIALFLRVSFWDRLDKFNSYIRSFVAECWETTVNKLRSAVFFSAGKVMRTPGHRLMAEVASDLTSDAETLQATRESVGTKVPLLHAAVAHLLISRWWWCYYPARLSRPIAAAPPFPPPPPSSPAADGTGSPGLSRSRGH